MELKNYLIFNTRIASNHKLKSIAVILIENNEIVETYYSKVIVKTEYGFENPQSPTFREIWPKIKSFFDRANYYVAFKIAVHKGSLVGELEEMLEPIPPNPFFCINTLALQRLNNSRSDKESLIKHFDIFHEGSDDENLNNCYLSFEILKKLLEIKEPSTIQGIIDESKENRKQETKEYFRSLYTGTSNSGSNSEIDISETTKDNFKNLFEGKTFLVTGNFENFPNRESLVSLIESVGGKSVSGISKKLNFLIVGSEAGPSKLQKATDLKESGVDIKLLGEDDINELLD